MQILDNNSFSLTRALEIDPQFLDAATSSEDEGATAAEAATPSGMRGNPGGGSSVAGPSSAMPGMKRSGAEAGVGGDDGSGAEAHDAEAAFRAGKKPRRMTRALHDLNFVRSIGILLPGALDNYLFNMFMRDLLLVSSC